MKWKENTIFVLHFIDSSLVDSFFFSIAAGENECQIVSVWPSFASLQTLELLSIMMTRLVFTLRQGGEGE